MKCFARVVTRVEGWRKVFLVGILVAGLGLTGCATSALKASPSQGAGFVPLAEMTKEEGIPFQAAWIKEGVDWRRYSSIYIREVNTDYLMESNWWQQNIRRGKMQEDVDKVADYMVSEFRGAFRDDPLRRFRVLALPEPGCLTLELALTELVPSNVLMEALSMAAPYGSGFAVQAVEKQTGGVATVAFEARLKDESTGEALAMFADREQPKINPLDLKGLTWYGEARSIIDEWADQSVQLANARPGEIVKGSSPFSLKPW